MKNIIVILTVIVLTIVILSIFYLAKRNFAVCRFIGGNLEVVNAKCHCTGQPCITTICSHENRCILDN